jgi:hypothetical protein
MGKYSSYVRKAPRPPRGVVHPVMRGIGCIMIVVVPILAYGISLFAVDYAIGQGWPIPPGWLQAPTFPPLLLRLQGVANLLGFLQTQPRLIAHLVFTAAISLVIGGVMSIVFGYFYQIFGPSRYGPTDVPPPKVKPRPYKR